VAALAAVLSLVGLLLPMLPVTADQPASPPTPVHRPETGATFGAPGRAAVRSLVVANLRAAPAGARVRGVVAAFDHPGLADELAAAAARGVVVEVLAGGGSCARPSYRRLQRALDPPTAARCARRGARGIGVFDGIGTGLHQKSWTFSRTGDASWVSVVTSANATVEADRRQYTDAYQVVGDRKLYGALAHVFGQQWRDRPVARPLRTYRFGSGDEAQFLPWNGPRQADPVLKRIRSLPGRGTVVRIANSAWWGPRGERIARALADLERRGGQVRVLASRPLSGEVRRTLRRGGAVVREGWWGPRRYHHLKLMTAGYRRGGESETRVWTGSENWTSRSRGNDEIVLRIGARSAHREYAAFFDGLWRRG
jgi:phosphatidylserine/phosphatidylglycerophosphate/cardiolipin synthase-like enzyme